MRKAFTIAGAMFAACALATSAVAGTIVGPGPGTLGISGNWYGLSIAPIPDPFHDGTDGYAVGAPYAVYPGGGGEVYVYRGKRFGQPDPPPTVLRMMQPNTSFGTSVASPGDVNGDGWPDLLVGAPYFTTSPHVNCGRAFLYLGGPGGISGSPAWFFETLEDNALVGSSVAWTGDVNRDGYDDFIVTAPQHTNGQSNEGAAYLFFGGPGLPATTPAWTFESDQVGGRISSASGAGDVNADGYADFLLGSYGLSRNFTYEGGAFLFTGGPGLPSPTPTWTWYGGQANAYFGNSLSTAGDVDGDGYSDFVIGAYGAQDPTYTGDAYVFRGGPYPATIKNPTVLSLHVTNASFGQVVAPAGDVNGDGRGDILILAPNIFRNPGYGAGYVYLGSETGIETTPFDSLGSQTGLESSVYGAATLGDRDGDGKSDWAVGILSTASGNGELRYSQPRREFGTSPPHVAIQSLVPNSRMGQSACTLDADGDGFDDLVVGSPSGGNDTPQRGSVELYRGGPSAFQPIGIGSYVPTTLAWSYEGGLGDHFGFRVANAGDVNRDGFEDLIVGSIDHAGGEAFEGEALLFYGSLAGLGAGGVWRVEGNQVNAHFGMSVAGGGDLNGDGYDDVAVAGVENSIAPVIDGYVRVFLGSALGLGHVPVVTLPGDSTDGETGVSCAIVGDVNRDGYDDLVVGAPDRTMGESREGVIRVYLGSPTGVHDPPSQVVQGNWASAGFGTNVVRAGDVNGDGYADVLVAAPYYSDLYQGGGRVSLYFGSPAGLVEPAALNFYGEADGAVLGLSGLAGADTDRNGYSDIILGFPYEASLLGPNAGHVRIYQGGPDLGLSISEEVAIPKTPNERVGTTVGGEADFNGDGARDLFVTAPGTAVDAAEEGVTWVRMGALEGYVGPARPVSAWRTDGAAPIVAGSRSNSTTGFNLKGFGRSAAGRTKLALEWEVKPLATPFDFSNRQRTNYVSTASVVPGAGSSLPVNAAVTGLAPATAYRWRARWRSTSPFFPDTPWFSDARRAPGERALSTAGGQPPVAVEPGPGLTAATLALSPPSPNPCTGRAALAFTLPSAGRATLTVHDLRGALVRTLFDGAAPAGRTGAAWDGRDQDSRETPAGAYFVRLSFAGQARVEKLVRVR